MGRGGRNSGNTSSSSSSSGRSFSSSSGRSFSSRSAGKSRGGRSSSYKRSGSSGRSTVYYSPRRYTTNHYGGTYMAPPGGNENSSKKSGFGTAVIIMFVILVFIGVLFISIDSGDEITRSTIKRDALPAGYVNETEYFTDNLGWISNKSQMEKGLKYFYKKTGIQPYVYITGELNGKSTPTDEDARLFAEKFYNDNFSDEAHFLLIFQEYYSGDYHMWQMGGKQTKVLMDKEAVNILFDYLEEYYYSDLDEEEFFTKAFTEAADRIMTVQKSKMPLIIVLSLSVVVIFLLYTWWKKIKEQKNKEAKQMEDMLNTPLETFSDDEAERLSKKYENINKGE